MLAINQMVVSFPAYINEPVNRMIESCARRIELPAKKIFVCPGDAIDTILFIAEGRTRHYMISSEGIEKVIYILNRGWFLRESVFVFDNFRVAARYSITEMKTVLFSIDFCQFNHLMEFPDFAKALLRSSCIKNEVLRRHTESLTFDSGKKRFLKLLVSLADRNVIKDGTWHPLTVKYTQSEIASIIGVNRVTISRFTSELCDEGAIRVVNRRIQLNSKIRAG
jgi:CRP/FNR family cyclic AMP-dependent transcriptional regulator